jgi:hypothetical protein
MSETRSHRFEEVLAYEQGCLTDDENMELELHMRNCKDCRDTLETVSDCCLPEMYPAISRVPEDAWAWDVK